MSTATACRSCCAATRIGWLDPASKCGATPARRRNRSSCWTAGCHGAGTTWRSGFASSTTPRSAVACARAGTAITACATSGRWAPIRGSLRASRTPGRCSARAARSSTAAWPRAIRSTRAAMGRSTWCAATWPATSPWSATSARAMRRRSRSPSGSPTPAACRCGFIARVSWETTTPRGCVDSSSRWCAIGTGTAGSTSWSATTATASSGCAATTRPRTATTRGCSSRYGGSTTRSGSGRDPRSPTSTATDDWSWWRSTARGESAPSRRGRARTARSCWSRRCRCASPAVR